MKIRSGFVSNSSSSSFIASVKKDFNNLKVKVEIEIDFSRFQDKILTTAEEAELYINRRYGLDLKDDPENNYPYELKMYNEMKSIIDSGRNVFIGSVGSEDGSAISQFFYEYGLPKIKTDDIEIISGDNVDED